MAEFSSEKQVPLSTDEKVTHDAGLGGNKVVSPSDSGEEGIVDVSGINEKSLLRKLDWKLLPPLSLLYLLSFLDRSNGMFFSSISQSAPDARLVDGQGILAARLTDTVDLQLRMLVSRDSPQIWE
jgi:hypothetical protein